MVDTPALAMEGHTVVTDAAHRRATAVHEAVTGVGVASLRVLPAAAEAEDTRTVVAEDISVAEVVVTPVAVAAAIPAEVVGTAVAATDKECVELASSSKRSER
jgi:hypothetical protein